MTERCGRRWRIRDKEGRMLGRARCSLRLGHGGTRCIDQSCNVSQQTWLTLPSAAQEAAVQRWLDRFGGAS